MAVVSQLRHRSQSTPAPFALSPDQVWEGNDGHWSTFIIRVGTPDQDFRVLVSTTGQETWIPVPDGCLSTDRPDCGNLRGVQPFQSHRSSGFLTNASSTWSAVNLFELGLESNLNFTGNGEYGFDTVGLGLPESGGIQASHQVVAGIATKDFMFGMLPLGMKPTNFSSFVDPQPSLMTTLRNQSLIPSLSYGFTPGAYYQGPTGTLASLTLGGYDSARFAPNNVSFNFPTSPRILTVGLQSIQATNTLGGVMSFLPTGIFTLIDSTVPEIWLPTVACEVFERAFGLQYDPRTDRYVVNDTIHSMLLQRQPVLTFTLGTQIMNGETVSITFPYSAFDLQASWPIYPNSTNYFPLRRAMNSTQYTLGRTFLQEAYLVVDYERKNFSVSQAVFSDNPISKIVTIQPLSEAKKSAESGLREPILIGILVGIIVGVLLLASVFFLLYRRRRRQKRPAPVSELQSVKSAKLPKSAEAGGSSRSEMNAEPDTHEVDLTQPKWAQMVELDGGFRGHRRVEDEDPSPFGSPAQSSVVSPYSVSESRPDTSPLSAEPDEWPSEPKSLAPEPKSRGTFRELIN